MRQQTNFRDNPFARLACGMAALCAGLFLQSAASAETPEHFLKSFANFKFAYHEKVQDPEVFLATQSGDCDDFATLAAGVLQQSGYDTELYAVRMAGETHVVCYVPAIKGYLDYNNRADADPVVPCDGSLSDIARKVANSFGREWRSAYQFSYRQKIKWLVNSIVVNPLVKETLVAGK